MSLNDKTHACARIFGGCDTGIPKAEMLILATYDISREVLEQIKSLGVDVRAHQMVHS
jgi:hypothetical protein